jgi:Lipase (class 3)
MITFRGSVTSRDWLMDGKMFLTRVPNPILQQQSTGSASPSFSIPQSKFIGLHAGFYEYLFLCKKKDDINKYTEIIHSLKSLLENEAALRTFSINVTGHSLGGALATIFSFYAVLEKELSFALPITCINFASPKGGNIQFARAFQELELQKSIVCLRVANYRDIITERPDRLTCWTFCFQNAIFRHVGMELLLYPVWDNSHDSEEQRSTKNEKMYRIRYPRIRRSRLSQLSDDFLVSAFHTISCTISVTCGCCINDYMKWHSCDEYLNRIENSGSALQNLPMQDLHDSYHNIVSEDSEAFSLSMRRSKSRRANGS